MTSPSQIGTPRSEDDRQFCLRSIASLLLSGVSLCLAIYGFYGDRLGALALALVGFHFSVHLFWRSSSRMELLKESLTIAETLAVGALLIWIHGEPWTMTRMLGWLTIGLAAGYALVVPIRLLAARRIQPPPES